MVAKSKNAKYLVNISEWCEDIATCSGRMWVGIDPGLNGALAFIEEGGKSRVLGVPVFKIKKGNKEKSEYDINFMSLAIKPFRGKNVIACQELTHAMPGNGNVSMYSFGRGHGLWEAFVVANDIPIIFSLPQQWKKKYPSLIPKQRSQDPKEKQKIKAEAKKEALNLARSMFPHLNENLKRVSDDGKAEALLIANYCKTLCEGQYDIYQ